MNNLLLFYLTFTLSGMGMITAQEYSGVYEKNAETEKGEVLIWSLDLKSDHTFRFHFYRNLNVVPEENKFGKGSWSVTKNHIHFSVDKSTEIDSMYTMNLNGSKARIEDTSFKKDINGTHMIIYRSNISWLQRLILFKK